MSNEIVTKDFNKLYQSIRMILIESRKNTYAAINSSMIYAYWSIGKQIVEDEQNGKATAEYGRFVLENLSNRLKTEFGKGFDTRNLRYMRKFYLLYQNWNAVRSELTWTHYRLLLRVKDDNARNWYVEETIKEGWSSRQLDRQISTLYYERLLSSHQSDLVRLESKELLEGITPEQFILPSNEELEKQIIVERNRIENQVKLTD